MCFKTHIVEKRWDDWELSILSYYWREDALHLREAFTSCINCYDSTRRLRTRGILRDLVTRVGIYMARCICRCIKHTVSIATLPLTFRISCSKDGWVILRYIPGNVIDELRKYTWKLYDENSLKKKKYIKFKRKSRDIRGDGIKSIN